MNKLERLLALLDEEQDPDRKPFYFWHSFGLSHMKSEAIAAAAIGHAAHYQVDILRLASDQSYPSQTPLCFDRPKDLNQLTSGSGAEGPWIQRLGALEILVRQAGKKLLVVESLPNAWGMLRRITTPGLLQSTLSEHPGFVENALSHAQETLKGYLAKLMKAGVSGLALEIEGANFDTLTEKQYQDMLKPLDVELLKLAEGMHLTVAHNRDPRPQVPQMAQLPAVALQFTHGPSMKKLRDRWKGLICGGLDGHRIETASADELRHHIFDACHSETDIVTVNDPVSPEIAPWRLERVTELASRVRYESTRPAPAGAEPRARTNEPFANAEKRPPHPRKSE